ncbi:hypothetical protein GCM10010400_49980 [Streptomyces aculeolatus]
MPRFPTKGMRTALRAQLHTGSVFYAAGPIAGRAALSAARHGKGARGAPFGRRVRWWAGGGG